MPSAPPTAKTESRLAAAVAVLATLVMCCGTPNEADARLTVFAAASTAEVVGTLARSYDGARVRTSFGPSSGLARQIRDGAPVDVYVSASARWVRYLEDEGTLVAPPRVLCRNRLVCIAAPGAIGSEEPPTSGRELADRLAAGDRIAIADAGVPAGDYARQSLKATGEFEALAPKLVGQVDVRAVLRSVVAGEAVAGFVYATDARASGGVDVLFALDPSTHAPIEYFAAAVGGGAGADRAGAFLEHLSSAETRRVLRDAGFEVEPR